MGMITLELMLLDGALHVLQVEQFTVDPDGEELTYLLNKVWVLVDLPEYKHVMAYYGIKGLQIK